MKASVTFEADPINEPYRGRAQIWLVTSNTESGQQKVEQFPDWLRGSAVKYAFQKLSIGHKNVKVTLQQQGGEQ